MKWQYIACMLIVGIVFVTHNVFAATLDGTHVTSFSNNKVKINFNFSASVSKPKTFVVQSPTPYIILDFPGVTNGLKKNNIDQAINLGLVSHMRIAEAAGKTRAVIYLTKLITEKAYRVNRLNQGRNITLTISGTTALPKRPSIAYRRPAIPMPVRVTNIDFRRTRSGGGRIIMGVSNRNVNINVRETAESVSAELLKTSVPQRLQRRFDVRDFDTPVQFINLRSLGRNTLLTVQSKGLYQHLAYQLNNQFIIDIRPLTLEEKKALKKKNRVYTGERISLNFQNIQVRAVLQLIAEFTGLNVVTSDSVNGSMTLRLKNVPWDQALDIILKSQGLAERRIGNVLMIAPADEIAAREKQELEVDQQVADLAPLHSELIQVNYAKAEDIANLLKAKGTSILSERGTVSVDERTNTLWVQDTAAKINEVRKFIKRLDIPVRQVQIKARIVNVDATYEKELGVNFGLTRRPLTGTLAGSNAMRQTGDNFVQTQEVPINQRLNVNLPATGVGTPGGAGSIGIALAKLGGGTLLDLELSALEQEGGGEIISSPTLVTSNQQQAVIESGVEIPYQQATSSGATVVAFKKAVLSLQVTPHITPDNRLILTLQVNQDTRGDEVLGVPAINTREVQTQVLVNNGETIVLGGIYEQEHRNEVERIPFLGTLPLVGHLFSHHNKRNERRELLIFITPKIITQAMTYEQ